MWLDIHVHKDALYYQPYLDGQKLMNCFAASEEEGWADVYETDENGDMFLILRDKKTEEVLTEFKSKDRPEKYQHIRYNNEGGKSWTEELKSQRLFGKVELRRM